MKFLMTLINMLNEMSPYILLGFLIAGILHAFVAPATMTRHLSGTGLKAVGKAALFGIPLPLCSCGVLPTAVSLRRNGASRASATSFLIATPQTGVDSIAATYAMLGPAFAIIRPLSALVTSLTGGVLVGRSERNDTASEGCNVTDSEKRPDGFWPKMAMALKYGMVDMVRNIGGWLVTGLIIAVLITILLPDNFFVRFSDYTFLTMILVVIVAVPMYVCSTGSIPIALSLMLKGLSPGTAFVLLMAGPAANFASVTIISRTMGRRSAAIYLATIIIGAILFGLGIDYLLPREWFMPNLSAHALCHGEGLGWFSTLCSAILVALLAYAFLKRTNSHTHNILQSSMEIKIKGMNCPHCSASVEKGIAALPGVTSVNVDLKQGLAFVEGDIERAQIEECVRSLGFDVAL